MLFLSLMVSVLPEAFWAQPSGYFIEKPAALSFTVRKTWLSGTSPVAAAAASPVSAPAAWPVAFDDGEAAVAAAELVAGAGVALVADVDADAPQPAAARAAARAAAAPTITMVLRTFMPLLQVNAAVGPPGGLRPCGSLPIRPEQLLNACAACPTQVLAARRPAVGVVEPFTAVS